MSRQISKCDVQKLACICDILECTDVTAEQLQGLLPNTYIVDDIDILVQVHPAEHMYVMVTQQAMAAFGRWMLQELETKNSTINEQNSKLTKLEHEVQILREQVQVKESWLDKLKNLFK